MEDAGWLDRWPLGRPRQKSLTPIRERAGGKGSLAQKSNQDVRLEFHLID